MSARRCGFSSFTVFLMRRPSGSPHIINSSTGKNVIKDSKKKDSTV